MVLCYLFFFTASKPPLQRNRRSVGPSLPADTDTRRYNTMMGVNVKGSYLVSRACMPHLLLSPNPHVLTIAPAPVADHTWLSPHTVYSTSKIAMSFLSLALEAEFGGTTVAGGRGGRQGGVAFNTLWPRYAVATAAINFIGGERLAALSRTPAAVADAAFRIVTSPALQLSGRHFIDDDVLRAAGVVRFERYNVSPNVTEPVSDFFVSNDAPVAAYEAPRALPRPADKGSRGRGRVSDGGGGGSGGDGGDGGVVLLVVNAENGEDRRLCAAVARRVLRAGHKLALMAHHRREPASRKSPTSSERKQRMTAGGAREASDAVADELMEDIQSGASAAAAADAEPTETETETETEAEAAASEASVKDVKKRVFVQAVDLTDAKTIPDAIVGVVRRFYSVDAVVNLLRPTTAVASAAAGAAASTPGADFDELFDVLVRASFIVVREALPHLARSEGPRRIVALCPPPLAIRDHFRPTAPAPTLSPSPGAGGADGEDEASDGSAARCSRPALALARACQGLHLVGQAAEFAEVEPPIAVNGLWASDSASHDVEDGEEEEEENEDDDERLARAVALMLAAPPPAADAAAAAAELGDRNVAKDNAQLASGTFWRVEDVLGGGGGGGGTGSRARYKNHAAVAAACSTAAADSDAVLHPATTSSSSVAGASGVRDVLLPGYTTRDVVFPDPAEALAALLGGCGGREATLGWGL